MASFTGVGDNTTLTLYEPGEQVSIALSGTYNMTILFQREVGSPGSGAWETIYTYTTANATVAAKYTTKSHNEKVRLIVTVDTSGTATATLTNDDVKQGVVLYDQDGTPVLTSYQTGTVRFPASTPVALDAAITLTPERHANRPLTHSAAAGYDITMPAATGTGDVYSIHVLTTVATTDLVIQAGSAADEFNGAVTVCTDIAGVVCPAADADDTLTMNGSTTGGLIGSYVRLVDVATGVWHVSGFLVSSGAEADPWSAAVS